MKKSETPDDIETRRIQACREPPNADFWFGITEIMHRAAELQSDPRVSVDDNRQRKACQVMMHDLFRLLAQQPYFLKREHDLIPLANLTTAMWELNKGLVPPVLAPSPKGTNNGGQLANHARIKGLAARALTEFMKGGRGREEAAREIAAALRPANKTGLTAGTRSPNITWNSVANWRAKLDEGSHDEENLALRLAYEIEMTEGTPLERGRILIAELRTLVAGLV